jgi:hypothetical protein
VATETREVLYRGPATAGLVVDGKTAYPGDTVTLSDRQLSTMMDRGHRFQWLDGDIVRPYELGASREAAEKLPTSTPDEINARAHRLAEARERAHSGPAVADDPVIPLGQIIDPNAPVDDADDKSKSKAK